MWSTRAPQLPGRQPNRQFHTQRSIRGCKPIPSTAPSSSINALHRRSKVGVYRALHPPLCHAYRRRQASGRGRRSGRAAACVEPAAPAARQERAGPSPSVAAARCARLTLPLGSRRLCLRSCGAAVLEAAAVVLAAESGKGVSGEAGCLRAWRRERCAVRGDANHGLAIKRRGLGQKKKNALGTGCVCVCGLAWASRNERPNERWLRCAGDGIPGHVFCVRCRFGAVCLSPLRLGGPNC